MRHDKRWLLILLCFLFALNCEKACRGLYTNPKNPDPTNRARFEHMVWRAAAMRYTADGHVLAPLRDPSDRLPMASFVLNSVVHAGMSREDLIARLGEPDDNSYFLDNQCVYDPRWETILHRAQAVTPPRVKTVTRFQERIRAWNSLTPDIRAQVIEGIRYRMGVGKRGEEHALWIYLNAEGQLRGVYHY